jgi:aspartate oxidase
MITVSAFAVIANAMSLHLLQRSESTGVHMRARIPANSNLANRSVTWQDRND